MTNETIEAIRKAYYDDGESTYRVASRFQISETLLRRIFKDKGWLLRKPGRGNRNGPKDRKG